MIDLQSETPKINDEFEKSFQRWRKMLLELNMSMSMYVFTYVRMHVLMDKYIEQMNLSPSFFQLSFKSFRTSSILWISKIFDQREQTSLYSLLNFVEANLRYLTVEYKMYRTDSPETAPWIRGCSNVVINDIKEHRTLLDSVKPIISKIKSLRDKYHAHMDKSILHDRKQFVKINGFTLDELSSLPSICNKIVKFYSIAYDGEFQIPVPLNCDDLEKLLKPLTEIH